jgi:hypothetical protein
MSVTHDSGELIQHGAYTIKFPTTVIKSVLQKARVFLSFSLKFADKSKSLP